MKNVLQFGMHSQFSITLNSMCVFDDIFIYYLQLVKSKSFDRMIFSCLSSISHKYELITIIPLLLFKSFIIPFSQNRL